ncbi:hypothetical protein TSUD_75630 [Trifolium subterraneum]|nr:hypothetical protein TSUD_75630 [Trifolium subterraneum]
MSSSIDAFPAIQETMLEFRAGKMFLEGKRVVPDARKGLIRIARYFNNVWRWFLFEVIAFVSG